MPFSAWLCACGSLRARRGAFPSFASRQRHRVVVLMTVSFLFLRTITFYLSCGLTLNGKVFGYISHRQMRQDKELNQTMHRRLGNMYSFHKWNALSAALQFSSGKVTHIQIRRDHRVHVFSYTIVFCTRSRWILGTLGE